ncbi:MAG: ATP-binding protein [bacterium]
MAEVRGRVLVVDDSEDDHLQLQRLLRGEAEIFRAYAGQEALERLARDSFDVLVTDQKMPRMSGDELIDRIKTDPRTGGLRCILLSGRTSDEQLVRILQSGHIFRYFEKNRTLLTADGRAELVLAVRNGIQASRLEREHHALNARLEAQVDALSAQYRLLRALLNLKSPAAMVRLVVDSLADRVRCRGVFGLIDLRPEQGFFGHGAVPAGGRALGAGRFAEWAALAQSEYGRLSGRLPPEGTTFGFAGGDVVEGDAGPAPGVDPPLVPVFINQDLRGLFLLAREEPLAPDEVEVVHIWRDQLQDALTRVHTQLLDEQRRVELMVETMTEGVVLTDERGAVSLMNPVARRMLGIEEVERPDFTVVLRALGLSSLDVLRRIGVGESTRAEWWELSVGEATWQVLFAPVRDHAAHSVGILTVLRDVTTDKTAARRREEFVHIIGHELRSPLTSISGTLDLLGRRILGELSARQLEYVELAKKSCTKINQLLNDLLDLAKFEEGRMPLSVEAISLEQVVASVVRDFQPAALERGVELRFECLLEGLVCQADAGRIGQVAGNLLTNAIRHTPTGGEVVVSVQTTFVAPELYLVAVHNTGQEIDDADLERIFDKFEQVEVADPRTRGASGLGLAVCRNIVGGHGGQIWVESGEGQGTAFVFSLPEQGNQRVRPPGVLRAEDRAVLIVGRELHECRALKALLLGQGYQARICEATVAAVAARLARSSPAIALYLDVDGEPDEAVMAALVGQHGLPVLALLPPGARPLVAADASLEVPPDPTVLASMIKVVLARHRLRRRMRVLVADPDEPTLRQRAQRLEQAGYLAYVAGDAVLAARRLDALLPDLVALRAGLPDIRDVLERVRVADGQVPLILLGTPEEAAALGLDPDAAVAVNADDRDLLVALRSRLSGPRGAGADALVVLPGGREIQREVAIRMREQQPFAYCAMDIVGLHDAVERFGFMWGHTAMSHTAEMVHAILEEYADGRAFLGHQRDDDFVFVLAPEHVEVVCAEIERGFARLAPAIIGDANDAHLAVAITAIVDEEGRFDRYQALQHALSTARGRETGEVVLIDRGRLRTI